MSSSQSQSHGRRVPAPIQVQHEDDRLAKLKKRIKEMRRPLMLVSAVWAWTAYRSVLHPPGGYWKHDKEGPDGHAAGSPVMASYETFRMLTAMSFVGLLLLVVLLSSERFYRTLNRMAGLLLIALLDVACFVSAYVVATGPVFLFPPRRHLRLGLPLLRRPQGMEPCQALLVTLDRRNAVT